VRFNISGILQRGSPVRVICFDGEPVLAANKRNVLPDDSLNLAGMIFKPLPL
jgi:hypothetical protein